MLTPTSVSLHFYPLTHKHSPQPSTNNWPVKSIHEVHHTDGLVQDCSTLTMDIRHKSSRWWEILASILGDVAFFLNIKLEVSVMNAIVKCSNEQVYTGLSNNLSLTDTRPSAETVFIATLQTCRAYTIKHWRPLSKCIELPILVWFCNFTVHITAAVLLCDIIWPTHQPIIFWF